MVVNLMMKSFLLLLSFLLLVHDNNAFNPPADDILSLHGDGHEHVPQSIYRRIYNQKYQPNRVISSDAQSRHLDAQSTSLSSAIATSSYIPTTRKVIPLTLGTDKTAYLMDVQMGTPQQNLQVVFDTGSSRLAVLNKDYCDRISEDPPHSDALRCYNHKASNTWGKGTSPPNYYSFQLDLEVLVFSEGAAGSDTVQVEISIVGTTVFELSTAELELSRWSSLKVYPHTPYNDFHLHYLEYADGVFGANPQAGGFRSLFYHDEDLSYSSDSNFVFSLDLNDATDQITAYGEGEGGAYGKSDADSDSELHIDGMSDQYRDSLQWSAATAVLEGDSAYYPHSLEIHAMQVCGIDLINAAAGTASSASSSTTASATTTAALPKPVFSAIVDTASTCLSLPREVFDILKGWLPMDCEAVRGALPTSTPEHCFLPPSVTPVLPTIDLKISADGDWLHLPVAALLRDENSGTATKAGSRRVCVTRDYSYATQEVEGKPNIIFGNMALKAFYASFAMNPQRVGLANKVTATPSTVQCLQTIDCHGMQTLYEPLNVCVQPACHNYFFFTLNAAGDECELTQMFHILAFSFLSLFVIVEITLLEVQKRLSHLALQPEVSGHFG